MLVFTVICKEKEDHGGKEEGGGERVPSKKGRRERKGGREGGREGGRRREERGRKGRRGKRRKRSRLMSVIITTPLLRGRGG